MSKAVDPRNVDRSGWVKKVDMNGDDRVVVGYGAKNCIHRRPLNVLPAYRTNPLCQACKFEAPRFV